MVDLGPSYITTDSIKGSLSATMIDDGYAAFFTETQAPSTNLEAASRYADAGAYVFAARSSNNKAFDKKPMCVRSWSEESTLDRATIERFFKNPTALVAVDCGRSNLVVIDADRHGGPDGVAALREIVGDDLTALRCPIVETAGGGLHAVFAQPTSGRPFGNAEGALKGRGINVRGSGGYVIGVGSVRHDGRCYRQMAGTPDLFEALSNGTLPQMPEALAALIRAPKEMPVETEHAVSQPPSTGSAEGGVDAVQDDGRIRAWKSATFAGIDSDFAQIVEGGRNNHLAQVAAYRYGRYSASGFITKFEAWERCKDGCQRNGLWRDDGPNQCRKSFESGFTAGCRAPHPGPVERVARLEDQETIRIGNTLAADFEEPHGAEATVGAEELQEETLPVNSARDELPESLTMPAGVLGLIIDWIVESAQRPNRVLALGAAIAVLATITGRRVVGPTLSGTHQYLMMLAASAAGKDHPLRRAIALLNEVSWELVGPGEFTSQTALIRHVSEKPLSLCAMDELGAFVARICHHRAGAWERGITKVLRELWGASFEIVQGTQWATDRTEPIRWPSLSILGVSTHQEFFDAMSSKEATNGFLNRFLMLSTVAKIVDVDEPIADRRVVPIRIKEILHDLYQACSGAAIIDNQISDRTLFNEHDQIPIGWADDDVRAEYRQMVKDTLTKAERATIGEIYGRTAEMAIRLATIHAVSRAGLEACVTHEDFAWGRELAMWSAETMAREASMRMSDTEAQARANQVLQIVYAAGGQIKHRDLHIKLRHRFKLIDLRDTLAALLESGAIVRSEKQPPRGGKTTVVYTLAGHKGLEPPG